jgi:type IV pilus assembly protein PilE
MTRHPSKGFSLVECALAGALAVILLTVAVPSFRHHLQHTRRLDAVQALTRVQVAQEQRRAAIGLYASDLSSLGGLAATSPQGLYRITLAPTGPDSYRATAQALGSQAHDTGCTTITLDVTLGFPQPGPNPACWNR